MSTPELQENNEEVPDSSCYRTVGKLDAPPTAVSALEAAMDPWFGGLSFLSQDEEPQLKAAILQCMTVASIPDKEASTEPPSQKKTRSAIDEILGVTVDDTCLSTHLEEELQLFFSEKPVATDRDPL